MEQFSRARFDGLSSERQRSDFCAELAKHLSEQFRGREFHKAAYALIAELKLVGHDLWSQDEDDEFQVWGPNYEAPRPGGGLVITFVAPGEATVSPVSS